MYRGRVIVGLELSPFVWPFVINLYLKCVYLDCDRGETPKISLMEVPVSDRVWWLKYGCTRGERYTWDGTTQSEYSLGVWVDIIGGTIYGRCPHRSYCSCSYFVFYLWVTEKRCLGTRGKGTCRVPVFKRPVCLPYYDCKISSTGWPIGRVGWGNPTPLILRATVPPFLQWYGRLVLQRSFDIFFLWRSLRTVMTCLHIIGTHFGSQESGRAVNHWQHADCVEMGETYPSRHQRQGVQRYSYLTLE